MRPAGLMLAAVLVVSVPSSAAAWGLEAHKAIMSRALDALPPELKTFFEPARASVVERSVDPDMWRLAGFEEEPPRHFLDLDAYGAYPFTDLPRDYDRAVAKYGAMTIRQNGLVPWRAEEMFGNLRRAFLDAARGSDYGASNARFYASILAHYVSDAHVPLHAVVNYDGQLTNQRGVHARFESDLFERYRDRLHPAVPSTPPIDDMRTFVFDTLLTSYQLVPRVLEADAAAAQGRSAYDDAYFARFYEGAGPILEQRVGESIGAVVAAITGAWHAAGSPVLRPDRARQVKPIPPKSSR